MFRVSASTTGRRVSNLLTSRNNQNSLYQLRSLPRSEHQSKSYTVVLAPKHIVPKTWSDFEKKMNLEYIERDGEEIFDFLGLDPNNVDFSINASNFDGFPYYGGFRMETDQMLVDYLADKADRLAKLDPATISPLNIDYMLKAIFYHVSTRYFYGEIASKEEAFLKPVSVPLWLNHSKGSPADHPGTEVRLFKDRHDHVRPDLTLERVIAHTIHRIPQGEEDIAYLRSQMRTMLENTTIKTEEGEVPVKVTDEQIDSKISTVGLVTLADVSDLAYDNIPDTFDFGRMRSIINYGTYNINPVMPMMTVTGSLVKFSIGLFDREYCEACTQVAQHMAPKVSAKVIGFCGSDDINGWNLLKSDEREMIFRYLSAFKSFTSLPLKDLKSVNDAQKLL